jgi:N-acetylmuramoyl-L-alanine amidase
MARFTCANWRPISVNMGGNITSNLGLVLHHQAGNGSLFNFFNSSSAQVSAHFWVSKTGTIEQYVDTSRVAWHGRSLNSRYIGVETEGCPTSPYAEPLTDAAIQALARIYKEGNQRHGWINALASADGQKGFGFHRMAVATGCPCDVRLNRRRDILNIAFGSTPAPTPTPPTPAPDPYFGGAVFIRNNNIVYQLIYNGPQSYWRSIPAGTAAGIPSTWIIADPNGSWLALWRIGANG